MPDDIRVLSRRLDRLEDLLEAATAERDHLRNLVDSLEARMYDAETRLRNLDGLAPGQRE